jgi:hypothetical protein
VFLSGPTLANPVRAERLVRPFSGVGLNAERPPWQAILP